MVVVVVVNVDVVVDVNIDVVVDVDVFAPLTPA